MNTELLFQLYSIHAKSGSEKKMRKFLRKQAMLRGAQSVETDRYGNVLITKGEADTYPCLAAHMDQVQSFHSRDFEVVQIGDDVIGWSRKSHSQQGLGADDKNGLFICLECLEKYNAIKVAFFSGEEIGCVGSSKVSLDFFKDCRFIIEPDRKGGSDLITSMAVGDVCSKEFIEAIGYKEFGYKEDIGSITDVGELVERGVGISCLNLSCGYYDAHTDHEMCVLSELENCLNFVQHIVETCTDVYPHEYDEWGGWYGRYGSYGGYGSYGSLGKSGRSTRVYTPKICEEQYDSFAEDEDYEMMQQILEAEPDISFGEVANEWGINFYTRRIETLRDIYDDVKSLRSVETADEAVEVPETEDIPDTPDDEFWGKDDPFDDVVFPPQKVS